MRPYWSDSRPWDGFGGSWGHRGPGCLWWGDKAWLPSGWLLFPPTSLVENGTSCLFYRLLVKCRGWQLAVLLLDASHSLMPNAWMVGTILAQPSLTVFVIHRNYSVGFDHLQILEFCCSWSRTKGKLLQVQNAYLGFSFSNKVQTWMSCLQCQRGTCVHTLFEWYCGS